MKAGIYTQAEIVTVSPVSVTDKQKPLAVETHLLESETCSNRLAEADLLR
jgi:hypothetical protein